MPRIITLLKESELRVHEANERNALRALLLSIVRVSNKQQNLLKKSLQQYNTKFDSFAKMLIFSMKRLCPTIVNKSLCAAYRVPRKSPLIPTDLKKLTPGIHLYNLKSERIIKVQHIYDLERVLYIPEKRIRISLDAHVTNPETACCALVAESFRPLEDMIEERVDRFAPQLRQKQVQVVEELMGSKIQTTLARKKDEWGLNVSKIAVRITERASDDEDIPPLSKYTVYG